jgi:hypothetical protein
MLDPLVFSIVRLELFSAVITARAVNYVLTAFEKQYKIDKVHRFTDSLINLCRLKNNPTKYKIWVANRLEEIILKKKTLSRLSHSQKK